FVADVPDVPILTINFFLGRSDRNILLLSVINGVFSRLDTPFPPGGNDFQVWSQCFVGQFKSNLIIAFAGAAMGYCIRSFPQGNFYLSLGQDGTSHRSPEQVFSLINRPGA